MSFDSGIFNIKNDKGVQLSKEELEDEVIEAAEEAKREAKKPEKAALLKALRKNDDEHNRTCAACLERLPIEKFRRGKQSEVCEDYED